MIWLWWYPNSMCCSNNWMYIPSFKLMFQIMLNTDGRMDGHHLSITWLFFRLTYIKSWPLYFVLTSCKHVHLSNSYGFRQCIFACFIKQKLGQCIHIVNKILMNSSQHISSENVQHTSNISKNYILIYQSYFQLIIHWALITVKVTTTDWQLVWSKQYGTQNILIIIKINNP